LAFQVASISSSCFALFIPMLLSVGYAYKKSCHSPYYHQQNGNYPHANHPLKIAAVSCVE